MSRSSVAARAPQKRRVATTERLLDAAAEVFIEQGYDRTKVADIALRASVTVGAIYSNFRGKADILLEVMRRRLKQQNDEVKEYVKSRPDISTAFLALARDRNQPGLPETRALTLEIFAAARRDPAVREVVADLMMGTIRFMTSRIRAAQEEGLIDKDVHAPSLAWLYVIPAAGEAFAEAAGLELPPLDGWLPLLERITGAVAAPGAAPSLDNLKRQ